MPSLNHIHQYKRDRNGKVWRCVHPLCSWQGFKEHVVGKAAICNGCKETIVSLTSEQIKRSEPKCINCMDTKVSREYKETKEKLKELGLE